MEVRSSVYATNRLPGHFFEALCPMCNRMILVKVGSDRCSYCDAVMSVVLKIETTCELPEKEERR